MATDRDIISDAADFLERSQEAEQENRSNYIDDLRFARLGEQWERAMIEKRAKENRVCLTINKMPQFLRQVVNDARRMRPSVHIKPVDSNADRQTALIYDGLIRNIEVVSGADVAYDTGIDCAVTGGFGYWVIGLDYASDDTFDMDISIDRVVNPLTVHGDPVSTSADSSDWNCALHSEMMEERVFLEQYPGAKVSSFDAVGDHEDSWHDNEKIRVGSYWKRSATTKTIVMLSDGTVLDEAVYMKNQELYAPAGLTVVSSREINAHKVVQYLMTGAEVLKTVDWPGKYIPIVPIYGEEVWIEGRRHTLSLVRHAKDPQRNFNYWRTSATETVALSPRVPYVGPKGFAKSDPGWETANTESHPYLEYDGAVAPQRHPLDAGIAAGAIQEAANATDDMKAVIGIYDASLGARSNETSGVAIRARQSEGNTGTFHFHDNQMRAIRHTGRILVDLIPKVYTGRRALRVLGEDGKVSTVNVAPQRVINPETRVIEAFSLGTGKYDVVVKAGPSFATRREESAAEMLEFARNYPPVAPILGDIIARAQDWPEADKVEERMRALLPPPLNGGPTPQEQQMMKQIQQMQAQLQQLMADNQKLQAEVQNKRGEMSLKDKELDIDEQKLLLEAQKIQNEANSLQQQLNQAQSDAANMAQSMQQMMAQMQEAMAVFSQPKFKKGNAVKLDDGTWELSAVEQTGSLQ